MKIYQNLFAVASVTAALTMASQARADTIVSFWLLTPESGTAPTQAQAVEVTVDASSSTMATVTFQNPGSNDMAPVELNVNGTFSATSAEGITTASGCCGEGAGTFGTMSLETGSANHSSIVITLTATGTNSWANADAVLTDDSKGFEAVVAGGFNGIQDGGAINPSINPLTTTPLPGTLPLFAGGLGFLGYYVGKRRKQNAKQALAAA
jgi:hypothetical protein